MLFNRWPIETDLWKSWSKRLNPTKWRKSCQDLFTYLTDSPQLESEQRKCRIRSLYHSKRRFIVRAHEGDSCGWERRESVEEKKKKNNLNPFLRSTSFSLFRTIRGARAFRRGEERASLSHSGAGALAGAQKEVSAGGVGEGCMVQAKRKKWQEGGNESGVCEERARARYAISPLSNGASYMRLYSTRIRVGPVRGNSMVREVKER